MARTIELTDAMQALAELGIKFTDAQKKELAAAQEKAMRMPALEIFMGNGDNLPGKCSDKSEEMAESWVARSFDFAALVSNEIVGEQKNVQGGGNKFVRVFGIDTPNGHLKVELKS